MRNFGKSAVFFLLLCGFNLPAVEDFNNMPAGSPPSRPRWGATKGRHWQITESGDDHGRVLEIGADKQAFARCEIPSSKGASKEAVTVSFDFKVEGESNQEVGLMANGIGLPKYFQLAAVRVKFNGRLGLLQYLNNRQWTAAGRFRKNEWNRLTLNVPGDGSVTITVNGRKSGPFPVYAPDGKRPKFDRLWFTDFVGGGKSKLFIDNLELRYTANAPASAVKTAPVQPERVKPFTFQSKALGKEMRCFVILPKGAKMTDAKKLPLLVVLHGRGRNASSLLNDVNARRALLQFRGVVLLVQGDDGWYVDSPVKAGDRYGSMMTELLKLAREKLPVSPRREAWGIAGWSMGGYGAAMTAEAHPETFSALAILIGVIDYPRTGLPPKQSYPVVKERFGTDPAVWAKFNPLNGTRKLAGMKVWMRTGSYSFDLLMNRNFRDKLKREKLPCNYAELPGGHEFVLVCAAMHEVVQFMNANLK